MSSPWSRQQPRHARDGAGKLTVPDDLAARMASAGVSPSPAEWEPILKGYQSVRPLIDELDALLGPEDEPPVPILARTDGR